MTVHVQMPNTLALNVNSPVRVADIEVGSVRDIELNDWVATLTLGLNPNVVLPANAVAKIGQTSLLGSQHVELAAPENPHPRRSRAETPLRSRTRPPSPPPNKYWRASRSSCAAAVSPTSR